jgi:Gpi18-like mannosyltransferase
MKRAPTQDIILLFLATRFLLMLVTYVGYVLLTQGKYSGAPVTFQTLLTTWDQWDAKIYLRIAQTGYQPPYDLAFFPLFPLLIAIPGHILGNWSYLPLAIIISNAALLGSLFIIYQLAADIGGDQVARRTILYLCIFPTAFFFFAPYNESLFVLLSTGTLLALRRHRWWLAGILGLLAALTRNAGILLVIPYLYELWLAQESLLGNKRKLLIEFIPIVLIPLGTLLYSIYSWKLTASFFTFATVQAHWSRQLSWPWQGFIQTIFELFIHQPFGSNNQVEILIDTIMTIAFMIFAYIGRKKMRPTYTIWMCLLLLSFLISPSVGQRDAFISSRRFVLEMFPGFITLAMLSINRPRLHQTLLWIFPALLATLSLLFVMGRWMV